MDGETAKRKFDPGEGLIGQAAQEQKSIALTEVPAHYLRIRSGLGEADPVRLYVWPVVNRGQTLAVVEMASFSAISNTQQALMEALLRNLGIIFESANSRIRLSRLLAESQAMTEELQVQSEELQTQQEELKATNEELEAQTQALRRSEEQLQYQQEELEQANTELRENAQLLEERNLKLEEARAELEEKARQLEQTNTYKSQFLANMSHELRTPLNSLLILSKLLADNAKGNLSDKQVEYARTIYSSGSDLLRIINDILDLAKVEAGKLEVTISQVSLSEIHDFMTTNFQPLAVEKNITFTVTLKEDVPATIYSDELKLQQILRNLLSNAFKFTNQGEVAVEIGMNRDNRHQPKLYFAVKDTGIGIPQDKQELIFEAFQQADGSTSRQYGGTGLGLSICRQLAGLLHGQITVDSEEGSGSTFTLWLTEALHETASDQPTSPEADISASVRSAATHAVNDDYPSVPDIKRVLIMAAEQTERNRIMEQIADRDIILTAVSSVPEAITEGHQTQYDYVILQLQALEHSVIELLKALRHDRSNDHMRVFLLIDYEMSEKEETLLRPYADSIIMNDGYALQRLAEEIDFELQNATTQLAASLDVTEQTEHPRYENLMGKSILIVDDDVRNVFALTNVLELHGMQVHFAENGVSCLAFLEQNPQVDLILMDIMMPEMDGYETMRAIRAIAEFQQLPVIALTAKAMKEDRELCIAAGASDYLVKPVQMEQLLSLIQVWLYPAED